MMDYEQLKALVKEMRSAQKEFHEFTHSMTLANGISEFKAQIDRTNEAYAKVEALEKRVDDAISEPINNNGDVIIMKNGQKLVQGSLF